uniref:Galactose-specific lectin nattectin-like n=1 Tax=Poecilia reticulata TaxID=8081 RepID=A0A3P9N519_POERE
KSLFKIRCTSFHFPDCSCPTGWSQYGKRCFLFQNTQKDWASAERTCNDFGANLASIHDNNEHDFLKKLVKTETGSFQRTWVGGHDAEKEGVWLWSDGSKFDYNKWSSGQPDNTGSNEHCLAINYEGDYSESVSENRANDAVQQIVNNYSSFDDFNKS